jgi:tRNA (guanine-N7-)-methyltransferase
VNLTERAYNYIRRGGRLTVAQSRGLIERLDRYRAQRILPADPPRPIGVEIGFGMGQALLHWAQQVPDWQLYGIDLYQPGIGALADNLAKSEITNVSIIERPAQLVFDEVKGESVEEVRIYFPDPWPKKRHFKRRLIQPDFVTSLARALSPGGTLRIATDWEPYALWIRECLSLEPSLHKVTDEVCQPEHLSDSEHRIATKFERRGSKLGHAITDFAWVKKMPEPAAGT